MSGFVVVIGREITHPINVSFSPLTVQILDVFNFKALLIRTSMGTIWSFHDHSGALFLAAALGCAAFPPRPLRDFAGAAAAGASSAGPLTFSAERADQLRRNAYISMGTLCAAHVCWSSWSMSCAAASTSAAKPEVMTSSSLLIRIPGTASAHLRKLRRISNVSGDVTASADSAMELTASVVTTHERT